MLYDVNTLKGFKLKAKDGEIGKIKEFFFDDTTWNISYLIANTGNWLKDRQVLISPDALVKIDLYEHTLSVNLTKVQIESCPPLEHNQPVTRQYEDIYMKHYGLPIHSGSSFLQGMYGYIDQSEFDRWHAVHAEPSDPHLLSTNDTHGKHIHTSDGGAGHVHSFIIDSETWSIRYLVIDTHNLYPGKKILIAPEWIEYINTNERKIYLKLQRNAVLNAPKYQEDEELNRDYEEALHEHYNTKGYWETLKR